MRQEDKGKLIILSAPSGAGKSTLVRAVMAHFPDLVFSVSACNRPPRVGETDGHHYFFLSTEAFLEHIRQDEFLEWEEVYPGRYYGTLKSFVEEKLNQGNDVIFDVDVKGGLKIKQYYGMQALALFIMPPSLEVLESRLRKRSTEDDNSLKVRLGKAMEEMAHAAAFDRVIVNDDLEVAINRVLTEVTQFLSA
ncbi:MAG: guanylate kinase [Lentimicrobiaceae bacterium]|nr:guanylate kinase [Lentimicrobiaceae bacterium]